MPKIKKNKIEQCTKIFIYRDLNTGPEYLTRVSFQRPFRGLFGPDKKA